MPGRTATLSFNNSRGMGSRFTFKFPEGTDLSNGKVEFRLHDRDQCKVWQTDQSQLAITISGAEVVFIIEEDSIGDDGLVYGEVTLPRDNWDYATDIWITDPDGDPDFRVQGLWNIEEAQGPDAGEPTQPVDQVIPVVLADVTVQVNFSAAVGTFRLFDDPNPILSAPLLTNRQDIRLTDDTVPTTIEGSLTHSNTQVRLAADGGRKLLLFAGQNIAWPILDGTPGQVMFTDGIGQLDFKDEAGGLNNVVEDASPELGGTLHTLGQAILVTTALDASVGSLDDETGAMVLRGLDTVAGSVFLVQDRVSGTPASMLMKFDGTMVFDGTQVNYNQKVFFGAQGIELNQGAVVFDFAGDVGEMRAGTATDVTITAFAGNTITLNSDTQINLNEQIRIDNVGVIRNNGVDMSIDADNSLLLTSSFGAIQHRWVTVAGIVGQAVGLTNAGVLGFINVAAGGGLNALIDDPKPTLGATLLTNTKGIQLTDDDVPTVIRGDLTSTISDVRLAARAGIKLLLEGAPGVPLQWPIADGTVGQVLSTDGFGVTTFIDQNSSGLTEIVQDTSPELGGTLVTNAFGITIGGIGTEVGLLSNVGGNVTLARQNAALLFLDAGSPISWPAGAGIVGDVLTRTGTSGTVFSAPASGGINNVVEDLTPQLGGPLDTFGQPILIDDVGQLSKDGTSFLIQSQGSAPLLLEGGTDKLQWPADDGLVNQVMVTNGNKFLSFATRLANVSEDSTPSLGGPLNIGSNAIISPSGQLFDDSGVWTMHGVQPTSSTVVKQETASTPITMTFDGVSSKVIFDLSVLESTGVIAALQGVSVAFAGIAEATLTATSATTVKLTGQPGTEIVVESDTALKLKGGLEEFTWPSSDGASGDVIATDGSGVLSLVNPASVVVKDPGVINVLDPPDGFGFTKMENTLSGANALINDAAIADYINTAGVPLMFPDGNYPYSVSITANQFSIAPPLFFAPAQTVQHVVSGQSFAGTYFHWFGDRVGDANPVPFFEQKAEGGFGLDGICLIGQPGTPNITDPMCACALRVSFDSGAITNSGKAWYPFLTMQSFDCGIIAGNLLTTDQGSDNMQFGVVNFRDCRMGLLMLDSQQIGWYFNQIRWTASGAPASQITEVCLNILGGGQLNVHDGAIIANGTIWMRLSPEVGSLGSNNAIYRTGMVGEDGNSGDTVLLDDRVLENGAAASHKVIFDNFRHLGTGSGTSLARISGNGQLMINNNFNNGQLVNGLFLEGASAGSRAKCLMTGCDSDFTPETVPGTLDRVFTGSGFYSLAEIGGIQESEIRVPFHTVESVTGVGDNPPTGAARTAWNALAQIAKYSGSGPLGDTVDLTR